MIKINIGAADKVKVKLNEVFCYSGTMKMVEEIVPNFDEKNFHIVKKIDYDKLSNKKEMGLNGKK